MTKALFLPLIAALAVGALPVESLAQVTPAPVDMKVSEGRMRLSPATVIVSDNHPGAQAAALYLAQQLKTTTGLDLKVVSDAKPQQSQIRFVNAADLKAEGYRLSITGQTATVEASSDSGLFYGAVTLWQLATSEARPALPHITISDYPRYSWRGFMLDSARHFQTPAEIKRLIDVMAAHKLNVLHWHLVDDQGWRLEIKKYPKLTEVSAYRQLAGAQGIDANGNPIPYGGFYTQDEVRDLVAYAAARHVTIVPEIEMPGHALSAIAAYPQFGVTGEKPNEIPHDWGVYPYLYNIDDATFGFLNDILDEVMGLFPSTYIHIGGDEAIKNQWQQSPAIQARMRELGLKDEAELQGWFIRRIGAHLSAKGRKLIGWDEILEGGPDSALPPGATVMSWRGLDGAKQAAKQGHDTVLSPWPELYLDSRQSRSPSEPPGRGALSTLRMVYEFDSTPDDMTPEEHARIIGVQANAWTEHMRTAERLEVMTFPRLMALSEVGWTPEASRDWGRFSATIPLTLKRLDALGVRYNTVPFEPDLSLKPSGNGAVVTLALPLELGEVRYRVNGGKALTYKAPLTVAVPTTLTAQTYLDGKPLGSERRYEVTQEALYSRASDQLKPCQVDPFPHRLEDDAPKHPGSTDRAVFAVNIYKSCWIWEAFDLSQAYEVKVRVGQVPFNFQLAGGRREVIIGWPETPYGELLIRRREGDGPTCYGPILATLPLTVENTSTPGLSTLTGHMPANSGTADICLSFNRPGPDPIWAIDQITLLPASLVKTPAGNTP